MATIRDITNFVQNGVYKSVWADMGIADTGTPQQLSRFPQKSVQLGGTFGGATAVLEGSDDGVTYFTLKDVSGSSISATGNARFDFVTSVQFIRPRTSGGAGSAVDVTLISKAFGN